MAATGRHHKGASSMRKRGNLTKVWVRPVAAENVATKVHMPALKPKSIIILNKLLIMPIIINDTMCTHPISERKKYQRSWWRVKLDLTGWGDKLIT